jgi:hypothetical protein
MPIEALALLRISDPSVLGPRTAAAEVSFRQLSDGLIVQTGHAFAAEPDALRSALLARIGSAALAQHHDARGILFLPDVAAPVGSSYDAVVSEVGEGGVWSPPSDAQQASPFGEAGGLGALLGSVMSQLPPSLLSAASAAAQGDPAALNAVSAQVQALLGSSPALQNLAGQLSGMFTQPAPGAGPAPTAAGVPAGELASLEEMFAKFGGGDEAKSSLHALAGHMQAELANDPAHFEALAKRLLGDGKDDEKE